MNGLYLQFGVLGRPMGRELFAAPGWVVSRGCRRGYFVLIEGESLSVVKIETMTDSGLATSCEVKRGRTKWKIFSCYNSRLQI